MFIIGLQTQQSPHLHTNALGIVLRIQIGFWHHERIFVAFLPANFGASWSNQSAFDSDRCAVMG
jgi:hypothetical protein